MIWAVRSILGEKRFPGGWSALQVVKIKEEGKSPLLVQHEVYRVSYCLYF